MRQHIIAEIRRLAAEIGRPPGSRLFETETGLAPHHWRGRYWARWSDALREADFEPNLRRVKPSPDVLLEQLAIATRRFGRLPTGPELSLYRQTWPAAPSPNILGLHFGARGAVIARLKAWAEARPDYADVAALLPSDPAPPAAGVEGVVRLLRCRAHHRLARSGVPVAIPASSVEEHAIRTDDPAGVEAYWRRRFAYRRVDPEWFALTAEDVAAFKRWKEI